MYDNKRPVQRFLYRNGAPATMILLTANVVTFLVTFFLMRVSPRGGPFWWLTFSSDYGLQLPWTLVTWPLVASLDPISLICGVLWAFWVGTSLERSWGTRTFVSFLAATAALTALSLWVGGMLFKVPIFVQGLWLANAPLTIAWCVLNRRETILFYGFIPIPAPILAWLTVGLTWAFTSLGAHQPLLGLFALSGCAAAYWFVTGGRTRLSELGSRPSPPRYGAGGRERESLDGRSGGFNLLRWWKERQDRKRLEDMFRRSGYSDEDRDRR